MLRCQLENIDTVFSPWYLAVFAFHVRQCFLACSSLLCLAWSRSAWTERQSWHPASSLLSAQLTSWLSLGSWMNLSSGSHTMGRKPMLQEQQCIAQYHRSAGFWGFH